MGLISFIQSAGRKLGILPASEPEPTEEEVAAAEAEEKRTLRAKIREQNQKFAGALAASVAEYGIEINELMIRFNGGTAVVTGTATSQADAEKAVLIVGNTEGVASVDNQLVVEIPEPPAVYHTVAKGDSLWDICDKYYQCGRVYEHVFEANKPMLEHPDKIYPGQVLRIPPLPEITHTVKKGESLGRIAKYWYYDSGRYEEIFEANRDQLTSADAIDVGQILRIPVREPHLAVEANA